MAKNYIKGHKAEMRLRLLVEGMGEFLGKKPVIPDVIGKNEIDKFVVDVRTLESRAKSLADKLAKVYQHEHQWKDDGNLGSTCSICGEYHYNSPQD